MTERQCVDWDRLAAGYVHGREIPLDGLEAWREALAPFFAAATAPVLDLGAGTGQFARAFTSWFGVRVVAVEPSRGMLAQAAGRTNCDLIAGDGGHLPLRAASMSAAWLSNVIHHLPDMALAARELRRVLVPGAPVLIRSGFPGRGGGISLFKWFPEAEAAVDRFPTIEQVREDFGRSGFAFESMTSLPQVTAKRLADVRDRVVHRADTALQALTDAQFAAGMQRLDAAIASGRGDEQVVDWMDLLVLR